MEKQFLLDACTLYGTNFTGIENLSTLCVETNMLGLTNGGVRISITPDVRQIEFDGKRGRRIKGMNRILGWEGGVETNGLELAEKMMTASLLKKDTSASTTGYTKYVPSNDITYTDLVVVGNVHGTNSPMVVVLKDCFNEAGFALETADSSEGTYTLNAYANYTYDAAKDATGETVHPIEIYVPVVQAS